MCIRDSIHHDVRRFQVSVNDTGAVSMCEGVSNLECIFDGYVGGKTAGWNALVESLTGDELHDHEVDPILRTNVVDNADIGVLQHADGLRFLSEAGAEVRVRDQVSGKNLDGNGTMEASVDGAIDLTHSAHSQQ